MQERVDQANADADRFYYELNNADEAKARHRELLKSHDVMQARKAVSHAG